MQPEIELGPLTLQSFGLMMGLGFVVAGWLASKRLKEIGRPADWAYEMVFAALVGGIIGSRLYFIVDNYSEVNDDLLGNLELLGIIQFCRCRVDQDVCVEETCDPHRSPRGSRRSPCQGAPSICPSVP